MRAIWKGAITFGLVNVPVKLYSATENHDVKMHQVHNADGGRIRYQRRCEKCGEVVQWEDIDKAYDTGEQTVVLTDEDLKSLPVERNREIDVQEFVPSDQLDPLMFDKSYYLGPDTKSTKSYQLLRRTLEETDRTAIVSFTLRQKTRLAALRVRGDTMVLQSLLWADEVREADFPELHEDVKLSAKELEMSSSLVESYSSDFDPAAYTDQYQEELTKLIEARLAEGQAVATEETFGATQEEDEGGQVLDLMEALRRSVEASRKGAKATTDTPAEADEESAESGGSSTSSSGGASRSRTSSSGSGAGAKGTTKSGTKKSGTTKSGTKSGTAKTSTSQKKPAAKKSATSKSTGTRKKSTERKPA
ncbi:Ku protein [Georgenia sp. 10Sc9-8]|uniref:Non-homologous end joining protein Ku n=1 Tax=Georgenia halotolerans TaxID=3028317 RepID=A0ABT5U1I7_9MICO|nr:Ku protein [Georgenia halotolerans]